MSWFLLYIMIGICVVTHGIWKTTKGVIKVKGYNDKEIVVAFFCMLVLIFLFSLVWPIIFVINVSKWLHKDDDYAK